MEIWLFSPSSPLFVGWGTRLPLKLLTWSTNSTWVFFPCSLSCCSTFFSVKVASRHPFPNNNQHCSSIPNMQRWFVSQFAMIDDINFAAMSHNAIPLHLFGWCADWINSWAWVPFVCNFFLICFHCLWLFCCIWCRMYSCIASCCVVEERLLHFCYQFWQNFHRSFSFWLQLLWWGAHILWLLLIHLILCSYFLAGLSAFNFLCLCVKPPLFCFVDCIQHNFP